ncbi:unnamed protein product [Cuscuta europaea]|uniref:Uncharacterized protein n=1 Tax=Cuscuta europaea TaxID=41803 RepID=A0A9P0ZHJ0_CUSEU|nr:unnamed protein product [Cuscuta europaea]
MNHCGIQQSALVCPKPRRLGQLNSDVNDPVRPFRWYFCNQQEGSDSMAAADILEDIILIKGSYHDAEQATGPHHVASSPPFFCGSPPSRVSNPVVMDARFGDEQHMAPVSPRAIPIPSSGVVSSPSASANRKGGCVRASFGNNPAVRVEGFDCLDGDRRNCSIPALA